MNLPTASHDDRLLIGIDVGTGGARALAVTADGFVVAQGHAAFAESAQAAPSGRHEQSAETWWQAVCQATQQLAARLPATGRVCGQVQGVAVDGTSGTFVPVDQQGAPLCCGLMYNDARAAAEADELNCLAGDEGGKLGYRFTSSFALPKMLWLTRHQPAVVTGATWFLHQADFIASRLTGRGGLSDYSNALKTGYDLLAERWPDWLDAFDAVRSRLPAVVAPGTVLGVITPDAADQAGLPAGISVVAGASDGTAAFLASGAKAPGDYNASLGTTLVYKGLSRQIARHPQGLIYSHKLPGGLWLPGAASNTGAEWIAALFPDADLAGLDRAAAGRLPTTALAYPLVRRGERFPFLCDAAEGFLPPESVDPPTRFAAALQGTAFVERLSYEILDAALGVTGGAVFATGGGSQSDVWCQCRADVTRRIVHRPAHGHSAFGSAILAAVGTIGGGLEPTLARMVRLERSFHPDSVRAAAYAAVYDAFCQQLKSRGYL